MAAKSLLSILAFLSNSDLCNPSIRNLQPDRTMQYVCILPCERLKMWACYLFVVNINQPRLLRLLQLWDRPSVSCGFLGGSSYTRRAHLFESQTSALYN
ncbi:hypothetical protein GGS24DRAFT_104337 [Hypoxylon argillaceum]|nr:hypothetical protein GGS24DRAFT_104337 [Hypoxylon argillaceum]